MSKKNYLLSLFIGFSLLSGCAVNETASVKIDESNQKQTIIESNSGLFSQDITVTDTIVAKAGDLLKVQVTIKNDSRNDAQFQYKFKWLDKDGFELSLDSRPWQPLSITAYESKNVQAVAPNPSAASFKILVQD